MTETDELEQLLEQVRKASDEIARIKELERLRLISSPAADCSGLESALDYWQGRKTEAERRLRAFR